MTHPTFAPTDRHTKARRPRLARQRSCAWAKPFEAESAALTLAPYDEHQANRVLDRMAGGESLSAICSDQGMPSVASFMSWLRARASLRKSYAKARSQQAEVLFDEVLAIADQASDGPEKSEPAQRARLRIEARKWILARMSPGRYGDKLVVGDQQASDRPMTIRVVTGVPRADD